MLEETPQVFEIMDAVSWIETAAPKIAEKIDAPADMKSRLVEIMVVSNSRGVQVDVHLSINMHRTLACESRKTLVEAVRAVRASLREKGLE